MGINLVFAWTDPTGDPPAGNVATPINVGSTSQTKAGDLGVDKLTVNDRYIYFGSQYLYGDNSSALYWNGAHDTVTQMIFRDKQHTVYGRVYGSGDGLHFGLLSADGSWGVRTTDSLTEIYHSTYLPTVYANIMYDRDNTGYYVNPASTSKFKCIRLGGVTECSWPSGGGEEVDTLDTVCDRGSLTNQTITTTNSIVANQNVTVGKNLVANNNTWGTEKYRYFPSNPAWVEGQVRCPDDTYMIGVYGRKDDTVFGIICAEL